MSTLKKRMLCLSMAVAFFVCILSLRLFYVQVLSSQNLQVRAAEQWYRDLPLRAPRGQILSQNGVALASNTNLFSVYVRPRAVVDLNDTAQELAEHLNLDREELIKKIKNANVSEITIARNISPHDAEHLRQHNIPGVYFTLDARRSYPYGQYLSQVLGYTNIDNQGQSGLELQYDKYLKGSNGFAYTSTDLKGIELDNNVTRYVPAIPGMDLTISVDSQIQHFAEDAVKYAHIEWKAQNVSMMVYDLTTGGIVANAVSPSFDLNDPPRDQLDILNQLSKNSMISDVYEPGSTFKIFTVAAALDAGVATLEDKFFCPGYRIVDGQRIRCWRTQGHGIQTFQEAVNNSCNCMIMDIAQRLGVEKLYSYLQGFGFGELTGVDTASESRGIMIPQRDVKLVDLVRIGFGQTIATTTLQMVSAVGAAVTGTRYTPYFAKSITTPNGHQIYNRQPIKLSTPIRQDTAVTMRDILAKVVSEGSGKKAQVIGYEVGGKTGTAQKYKDGVIAQGKYISSFVGFAPVDNPKYVALLAVDEPEGYLYYGSITAAPYVGRVFDSIANYIGITTQANNTNTIEMPNLLGLDYLQVEQKLKEIGLSFEVVGEGRQVIGSVPSYGTQVPQGDVVLIRFSD